MIARLGVRRLALVGIRERRRADHLEAVSDTKVFQQRHRELSLLGRGQRERQRQVSRDLLDPFDQLRLSEVDGLVTLVVGVSQRPLDLGILRLACQLGECRDRRRADECIELSVRAWRISVGSQRRCGAPSAPAPGCR
jgi:hypothetical protein